MNIKTHRFQMRTFGIIAAVSALMVQSCTLGGKDQKASLTGMAETTEIDISAKVAGRIGSVRIQEGAAIHEGDTVAIFESRELDAKVGQAKAALSAAQSKLSLAKNGLRPQEKNAAERLYMQAKAQADLMEKTWTRIKKLSNDSVISSQERDQIEAQYLAANEARDAALAKLSMANEGSRFEDQEAAKALVSQAQEAWREAEAWRDEQVLISPVTGEVAKKIANRGEVVGAGAPVATVVDLSDVWVVLNVKENEMGQFRIAARFSGMVKALGDTTLELFVSYIAPLGDFATWRPTNQKGGFDLKTFEIHLRPVSKNCLLRAGMSVVVRVH